MCVDNISYYMNIKITQKPHWEPLNLLKTTAIVCRDLGTLGKAAVVVLRNLNALKCCLFGDTR